jgi:hypothetical protein
MTQESGKPIPAEEWQAFFDQISRESRGQRALVEARSSGREWRTVASDQPFDGFSVSDEEGGAVVIELGGGLSYSAGVPSEIRVEPLAGDAGQSITIVQADGSTTALRLTGPTRGSAADDAERGDLTGVGGSAGAAGGSVAGPARGPGGRDDENSLVSFGSSDDMGGVAGPPGGSLGDQDLSGQGSYDISADVYDAPVLDAEAGEGGHAGSGSETSASGAASISTAQGGAAVGQHHLHPDVIDGGSGQGLLDTGVDPIEGGPLVPGNDDDDNMVEGEVGAQAEGDLEERIREDAERTSRSQKDAPKK